MMSGILQTFGRKNPLKVFLLMQVLPSFNDCVRATAVETAVESYLPLLITPMLKISVNINKKQGI